MNNRPSYSDYLIRILTASVYDVAVETPLEPAIGLSRRLNNNVLLKREDLQPVFSFKIRGAYNKMAKLPKEALACGVIAASAGNHAQGVALSAQRLGCRAVIVMPETTPKIKIDAVKSRSGEVVLKGVSYNDAYDYAMELAEKEKLTYIAPFDDPDVIAGQGTVGMEIVRQRPDDIHAIFVPIGGGGLAAGVAAFVKQVRPSIKVIGVQTNDSCCMKQSVEAGKVVSLKDVGLFSDGTAVKVVGEETFRLCRDLLDDIITVDTDAICGAIKDIFDDTRSITEPAGALALAGLKTYAARNRIQNQTLIAVTSGANMNFHRLRHVSERSELGEGNEGIFAVTIPEERGSFLKFVNLLGSRNITEFNYRYGDDQKAHIFVGLQTAGSQDLAVISRQLTEAGLPNVDLTDDENLQNPHPLHGRRTHNKSRPRTLNQLRVPRTPRRTRPLPQPHAGRLEHYPLPLPQPRRRLRPHPRRHRRPARRQSSLRKLPRKPRLQLSGRNPKRRIPPVPCLIEDRIKVV